MRYLSSRKLAAIGLLLALCVLPGCPFDEKTNSPKVGGGAALSGNGSGYGGGDSFLTEIRKTVIRALTQLKDGNDFASFATSDGCQRMNDPVLCNTLVSLSDSQKAFMRTFLQGTIDQLITMNTRAQPVPFAFTPNPLFLSFPDGSSRPVAAKTLYGPDGNIEFYDTALRAMSSYQQIQILFHENLHKVQFTPQGETAFYTRDFQTITGFPQASGGLLFLNAMGAALASYVAKSIGTVPVTYPAANATCHPPEVQLNMLQAPYFIPPSQADFNNNDDPGGQLVPGAAPLLDTIGEGDWTIAAWINPDPALDDAINTGGHAIFSNIDQSTRTCSRFGLQIARNYNGNLQVFGGQEDVLDSGLPVSAGVFHHVVARKRNGMISTFVDGVAGTSVAATYDSDGVPENSAVSTITCNSLFPTLAKGVNQGFSRCLNNQTCMDYFKGNIAQVELYQTGLTDTQITALYQCGTRP